jgi:hypothetical protein
MLTWQCHQPPQSKKEYDFGRDFVTLNRQSLKAGCIHPKEVADFRLSHEARIKPKVSQEKARGLPEKLRGDSEHIYGAASPPSEHVADLIQNRYELEWVNEQKTRAESALQAVKNEAKRRSVSPTKPLHPKQQKEELVHPKEYFTLKQFSNVPSRYFTPSPTLRTPSPSNQ